jgi:hypothetical protein
MVTHAIVTAVTTLVRVAILLTSRMAITAEMYNVIRFFD